MTHDSMIEVIAAHRDGKEIQFRRFSSTEREWKDLKTGFAARDNFDFVDYDYRIKPAPPKPREWWMNIYGRGEAVLWTTKASAEEAQKYHGEEREELVHVIEVLPSTGEEGVPGWGKTVILPLKQE